MTLASLRTSPRLPRSSSLLLARHDRQGEGRRRPSRHTALRRRHDCGQFRDEVVEYFVARVRAWVARPTPAPSATPESGSLPLLDVARRLGADRIATGHYARLDRQTPRVWLAARDRTKDQSYVLAEVPPDLLEQRRLPAGRAVQRARSATMAAEAGLDKTWSPRRARRSVSFPTMTIARSCAARLGERPGVIVDRGWPGPWPPYGHVQLHRRAAQGSGLRGRAAPVRRRGRCGAGTRSWSARSLRGQ